MTETIAPEMRIELQNPYVGGVHYESIDERLTDALRERKPIIIDLSQAIDGVQTEFFGQVWNRVRSFYSEEEIFPKVEVIKPEANIMFVCSHS